MTPILPKPRIMICSNTAWSLYNFRRSLIRALVAAGYEVVVVAPPDAYADKLPGFGCRYIALPMDNSGTSPMRDFQLLVQFRQLLARERPVAYLGYTIKPNVYGSLAAHSLGIPVINNIAGLGAAFARASWLTRVVKLLYRAALGRSRRVFFQNREDRALFIAGRLVREAQTGLLPGSGVDLSRFSPAPPRLADGEFRFLLVARMLWDKGVGEFVEAARQLRRTHPGARFQLLGFLDVPNPAAIARSVVEGWVAEGVIEYLGATEDVRPHLAHADCVVLPSYYREGVPRSLIEAAAMGRPIVTTDWSGCRDVVDHGINGYLCQPRDSAGLAAAMQQMLDLPPLQRQEMGAASRRLAETRYDENIVIARYLEAIAAITAR